MPAYMSIDHPKAKGDVSEHSHQGWIELSDFSYEINRYVNTKPGHILDRTVGRPNFGQVKLSKRIDASFQLSIGLGSGLSYGREKLMELAWDYYE